MDKNDLDNFSCFHAHKTFKKNFLNKKCRYWHDLNGSNNCIINKSSDNPHTLQEIGDLFDITRMRICQIEKQTIEKLKDKTIKSI